MMDKLVLLPTDVASQEVKEIYPDTKGEPQQSPKVCPVSGMFLEEPVVGQLYYYFLANGQIGETTWNAKVFDVDRVRFDYGCCFATREDAERYAKHLKAMAKLRRSGYSKTMCTLCLWDDGREIRRTIPKAMYNQLTTEEQNALLWPNEEK